MQLECLWVWGCVHTTAFYHQPYLLSEDFFLNLASLSCAVFLLGASTLKAATINKLKGYSQYSIGNLQYPGGWKYATAKAHFLYLGYQDCLVISPHEIPTASNALSCK